MFSGIIQNKSKIETNKKNQISFYLRKAKDRLGDSIAVNGVCLTVVSKRRKNGKALLSFDLSPETLKKTTFGRLKPGTTINVERALRLSDALNGHLVQGHVDGVGRVQAIKKLKDNKEIWFSAPKSILRFLVPKGSVAIDGVSLTVVKIKGNTFSTALIPFTLRHTNLGELKVGQTVNLEADMMAKYIQKYTKR